MQLRDEDLSKEMQESNWFSAPSALRVYGQYLNLDKDHNGMLSKEELARLVYGQKFPRTKHPGQKFPWIFVPLLKPMAYSILLFDVICSQTE